MGRIARIDLPVACINHCQPDEHQPLWLGTPLDEWLDDEAEAGLSFAHCTHAGAEEVISHLISCTCADREAH